MLGVRCSSDQIIHQKDSTSPVESGTAVARSLEVKDGSRSLLTAVKNLNIAGLRQGPGKMLPGSWNVLEFFVTKKVGTLTVTHYCWQSMRSMAVCDGLSVCLSVPSFVRRTPLLRVCCCAPGGQEKSIDCCTAGAAANAGSGALSDDVGCK